MIVKKVENPDKSASKATRINYLADYVISPEITNSHEKCIYSNARGFLSNDHATQKAEMLALAQEAVRSKDTINHYVLSWKENEQPTPQQIEEAIDIFAKELGVEGHQIIYGLHNDTDNVHCHIMINRVHPVTLKCVEINRGFDILAAHKAVARIEKKQGWQREEKGTYEVLENDQLVRAIKDPDKLQEPNQRVKDVENRAGEKSAQRIAIEEATPILKNATSWQQLHDDLAKLGMRYEKVGSGAKIYVDDIALKAGDVYRPASLPKLQKKLGVFEPSNNQTVTIKEPLKLKPEQKNDRQQYREHRPTELHTSSARQLSQKHLRNLSECGVARDRARPDQSVLQNNVSTDRRQSKVVRRQSETIRLDKRQPQPLHEIQKNNNWDVYISERKAHYAAKNIAKVALDQEQDKARKQLQAEQKQYRDQYFANQSFKNHGQKLNVLRSNTAQQQAIAKIELKELQQRQRKELRDEYRPHPTFEEWLKLQQKPELAEQWRYREQEPMYMSGDTDHKPTRDIRDYQHTIVGDAVHYSIDNKTAFIDRGKRIEISAWRDKDAALAALQLSQQKWGTIHVNGSDEYKKTIVQLAAEHGFKITNPELQDAIKQERARIQAVKIEYMKLQQTKDFERYAHAVGADRYRVTAIKFAVEKKDSRGFVFGKRDGILNGYTQEQVVQQMREMLRQQNTHGRNIYLTPLSDTKHHILIDDLSKQTLDRLIKDGYKPAVLIESSVGNYQAIITIDKLNTQHDSAVANRITERLNKEYGDPKLSGAEHAHRAPGFDNLKAKHQRDDGSYPTCRLVKAERRECEVTIELAVSINNDYEQKAKLKLEQDKQRKQDKEQEQEQQQRERSVKQAQLVHVTHSLQYVYEQHKKDIIARQRGDIDMSRVDSMIAERMRVTGHSQADIQTTLSTCAPALRLDDKERDWELYAERTARYAYSCTIDQKVEFLAAKYETEWTHLEGRLTAQEIQAEIERERQKEREKETSIELEIEP